MFSFLEKLKKIFKKPIQFFFEQLNDKLITKTDITLFLRQFATLISAGIPLIKSCEILEKTQKKRRMCILIYSIKRELLSGKNLYHSFHLQRDYFDALTCQLVRIGEQTGKIDMILSKIAEHHEKRMALNKRIKQTLFYPAVITCTAFAVTFSMFLFVIPRFALLFREHPVQLPLITRVIFTISDQLNEHLLFVVLILLLGILAIIFILRSPRQKYFFQFLSQYLPYIGRFRNKITLSQFTRSFAITFESGLPIKEALRLTEEESSDHEFRTLISRLINKINSGLQLHQAMELLHFFPTLMIQMIKIGEESSLLTSMLNKLADLFDSEIDTQTNQLSQLLEPLIMIMLGVLIGGLVIGMYLPIFKLGSAL